LNHGRVDLGLGREVLHTFRHSANTLSLIPGQGAACRDGMS